MKYLLTILSVLAVSASICSAQLLQSQQRGAPSARSSSMVTIDGESYYVHTVLKGETLYSLSKLYDVPVKAITDNNPHVADGLREGHVIKVPYANKELDKMSKRKQARIFETHIVVQGETLFGISRRYEIPVNTLLEDNEGLDPAHLSIGQAINIRKKSVGDATPAEIEAQMEEYKDALNSVSEDYEFHLVQPGETLYSLSRSYGVTEEDLVSLNNITEGLKAGALIKVRPKGVDPERFEAVSDSLLYVDRNAQDSLLRTTLTVKDFSQNETVDLAMLLPLGGEIAGGNNFLEFYQGALLGLEDMKSQGISTKMTLYNTSRSTEEVKRIVEAEDFGRPDIIIGPIYENNMRPALDYAQENRIVMVSPLAVLTNTNSPVLYQMSPDMTVQYEKFKQFFTPEKKVIFVSTVDSDYIFDESVKPMLPPNYLHIDYNATLRMQKGAFEGVIDPKADNLIVVSCKSDELVVDQILASISSVHSNLVARSQMTGSITVLGDPQWGWFGDKVDKSLFFKLNVCYPAVYHFDRGDSRIAEFDRRFVSSFGTLPTPYAYRGYDAVKLFVGAVRAEGADFESKVNASSSRNTLLQMPYRFGQKESGGAYVNMEWGLVSYGSDYTITVR